jgi:hypothetical protein
VSLSVDGADDDDDDDDAKALVRLAQDSSPLSHCGEQASKRRRGLSIPPPPPQPFSSFSF